MAQFATSTELADRLQTSLTAAEASQADDLLAQASALIVEETGQQIEEQVDDVLTRRGVYDRTLRLPERPVTSVSQVTIDGDVVDATTYYLLGDELVRSHGWAGPGAEVQVTYTHGYNPIPDTVKSVTLNMAARVWTNPEAVRQETYGPASLSYFGSGFGGLFLTEAETKQLFSLLARRAAKSVPLR